MHVLALVVIGGIILYIWLAKFLCRYAKKKFPNVKFLPRLIVAIFILLPVYDIILTQAIGRYYCYKAPKTFVNKTVEYPISVYFEDNVYPAYNKEDRKIAIRNYLDDIHIKKIALNGDDGKIYVYSYEDVPQIYYEKAKERDESRKEYSKIFKEYNEVWEKKPIGWEDMREKYLIVNKKDSQLSVEVDNLIKTFTLKEEIYDTLESMPHMNYTVKLNEVRLPKFVRNYIYSNEAYIIDNNLNETIAYDINYYSVYSKFSADYYHSYIDPDPICGERIRTSYRFFAYKEDNFVTHHDLQKQLYNKYIKQGK